MFGYFIQIQIETNNFSLFLINKSKQKVNFQISKFNSLLKQKKESIFYGSRN